MSAIRECNFGELFCCFGGIAQGAMSASVGGYQIVHAWANDYDQDTCDTYARNICPDSPETVICTDMDDNTITCYVFIGLISYRNGNR